jgi:hypothetical protein
MDGDMNEIIHLWLAKCSFTKYLGWEIITEERLVSPQIRGRCLCQPQLFYTKKCSTVHLVPSSAFSTPLNPFFLLLNPIFICKL